MLLSRMCAAVISIVVLVCCSHVSGLLLLGVSRMLSGLLLPGVCGLSVCCCHARLMLSGVSHAIRSAVRQLLCYQCWIHINTVTGCQARLTYQMCGCRACLLLINMSNAITSTNLISLLPGVPDPLMSAAFKTRRERMIMNIFRHACSEML